MVAPSWESFKELPQTQTNEFAPSNPQQLNQEPEKKPSEPSWNNFRPASTLSAPIKDDDPFLGAVRNIFSFAARGLEAYGGRYGDIQAGLKQAFSNNPASFGILGSAIENLIGPDRWKTLFSGGPENQEMLSLNLPTSKDLKKVTETVTGDYTKPKGPKEKAGQELASDIGSVFNLRGGGYSQNPNINRLVNNLGIPFSGNSVKHLMNYLGFGEDIQEGAKALTMIPLTLAYNINGSNFASELTNRGRNGIPDYVNASVPRYQNRLNQLNFSNNDPRTALARQQLAGIQQNIAQGRTSVRELMNDYDGVNAAKRDAGLFGMNRRDRQFAIHAINEVRDAVRTEIMDAAANYPDALRDWSDGINAFRAIHESERATNWIKGILKGPYGKLAQTTIGSLFGLGGISGYFSGHPLITPTTGAASAAGYKTWQVLQRMANNPDLARYYWQALTAAVEENAPVFLKNYMKADKENTKIEKRQN